MFAKPLDCNYHPHLCLGFRLKIVIYELFRSVCDCQTFMLQVGVGFLAQYLIKPILGFTIAMVIS